MQECISLFGLRLSGKLFLGQAECVLNEWVDKLVDDSDRLLEAPTRDHAIERATHVVSSAIRKHIKLDLPCAGDDVLDPLGLSKRLCEFLFLDLQTVDAPPE